MLMPHVAGLLSLSSVPRNVMPFVSTHRMKIFRNLSPPGSPDLLDAVAFAASNRHSLFACSHCLSLSEPASKTRSGS